MAQIGTVKLETQNSGVVDVPVFETGDSASGIYEFVRVETASGTGFIPVTDPADATYPYLRVQSQNNGIVAVTDTAGSDIPDSGNLQNWYAASELSLSVDDTVDAWTDEQGSEDLDGVGATYQEGINGNPSVSYDATDDQHVAQTASNWAFLHDGSPFSLYLVTDNQKTNGSAYAFATTGLGSTANIGVDLRRDNISDSSGDFRLLVRDGSSTVYSAEVSGEFPHGAQLFTIIHDPDSSPNYTVRRNGTQIASGDGSGHTSADPEYPLTLGEPQDSTDAYDGDHGEIPVYSVAHDGSTRGEAESYLANKYGISLA